MSTNEPLNIPDQGPVYYDTYEMQLQECRRLLRLPDKNLGRVYRLELERAAKSLDDLIHGRTVSIDEARTKLEHKKGGTPC